MEESVFLRSIKTCHYCDSPTESKDTKKRIIKYACGSKLIHEAGRSSAILQQTHKCGAMELSDKISRGKTPEGYSIN